ncbi:ABC transporter permease [Glycomyces sp. NPDC046736]|uniref:ABC transporter permease n=1 Tax=Glycomyces sp. NPDC046736 TaxID=3155615 RepID=UPI0033EA904E
MSSFAHLTKIEIRLLFRDPLAVVLSLILPTAILLGLGSVPLLRERNDELGGIRFIDYYAPSVLVMSVAVMGLAIMPGVIATYRERGMLRRMRTTPIPPGALLGAQLLVGLGTALIAALLVVVAGRLVIGVPLPQHPVGFAVAFVLGIAAVFSLGLVVAALAPNARVAQTFSTILFMSVMFFGGVYVPLSMLPDSIARIANYIPPGVGVLLDAWTGTAPPVLPLVIMGAVTLGLGLVSARVFKWE